MFHHRILSWKLWQCWPFEAGYQLSSIRLISVQFLLEQNCSLAHLALIDFILQTNSNWFTQNIKPALSPQRSGILSICEVKLKLAATTWYTRCHITYMHAWLAMAEVYAYDEWMRESSVWMCELMKKLYMNLWFEFVWGNEMENVNEIIFAVMN